MTAEYGSSAYASPSVVGPIRSSDDSFMQSTMTRAVVPQDLAVHGYLEEEYFISGFSNVYGTDRECLIALESGIPYVNRIIVRRPIDTESSSGVVWVDILNASNGFDVEDHWRRAWNYWIDNGHSYVGVTSKPINVEALKMFDHARYESLSWARGPDEERDPLNAHESSDFDAFAALPGVEEGLIWDIIAQTGVLLRGTQARTLLGVHAETIFLTGQSQSALYINTWVSRFHDRTRLASGRPVFDGYLGTGGPRGERPLTQLPGWAAGLLPVSVGDVVSVDVPVITIATQGDDHLFDALTGAGRALSSSDRAGDLRRHYDVAGTSHTDLRSPVLPEAGEIGRSGRLARSLDEGDVSDLNVVPLEPIVTGAMASLLRWARDGVEAPPSRYFAPSESRADRWGTFESGIAHGGLHLGLVAHPIFQVRVADPGDPVRGTLTLRPSREITEQYSTFEAYHDACRLTDEELADAGYLEAAGLALLHDIERELWDRAVNNGHAKTYTPQRVSRAVDQTQGNPRSGDHHRVNTPT